MKQIRIESDVIWTVSDVASVRTRNVAYADFERDDGERFTVEGHYVDGRWRFETPPEVLNHTFVVRVRIPSDCPVPTMAPIPDV